MLRNRQQVGQRQGTDAVRRKSDPSSIGLGAFCDAGAQSFGIGDEVFDAGGDESRLAGIGRFLKPGSCVGGAQQSDADAGFASGADYVFSKEIAVAVRRSIGGVMQVVKLA